MGNNKYKVLIVEDDQSILGFVQTILETNGYQVLTAERCRQGLLIFSSYTPDLVVLDLGLPDMDGGEFIRQVRLFSTVPIIVLSARTEENDKVSALDLGANDYITKPFGTAEPLARVRAALRASRNRARVAPSNLFTVDDLVIDYDRRQVSVGGSPVHLTQTEYNILALLSQHTGKVLTYATIIRSVWGSMDDGSVKKLQVNMANIRKKLGCRPGDSRYVINELGVGYRMIDEDVPCEDILSQLNAAKSALHKCGQVVLEGHIKHCVRDGIEHGDPDKTIQDFTKAVERFANMG